MPDHITPAMPEAYLRSVRDILAFTSMLSGNSYHDTPREKTEVKGEAIPITRKPDVIIEPENTITLSLSGSSKDRKKQFKAIQRKYPDCKIIRSAPIVISTINGKRIASELANTPQTCVTVFLGNHHEKR